MSPDPHDHEPVVVDNKSRSLYELARRVASTDCTVMISGESGTGKEVLARYIHRRSPRSHGPFVAVNCAAIPDNMLEAMLFGYEKGAFTGAHSVHAGKFEQAQGGTLLLDEVTEMPLALQAKLLRVLQEREVERLGGRAPLPLDVRVVATTNRLLRGEVIAGRFREDLYYRLCVFPLSLAPLRQRRDDILPLATQLLALRSRPGAVVPAISAEAAQLLLTHLWPGNVRELDNLLQRAMILSAGPLLEPEHLCFEGSLMPFAAPLTTPATAAAAVKASAIAPAIPVAMPSRQSQASGGAELRGTLRAAERDLILEALDAGGSRHAAASLLGISPRTLRHKLAQLRAAGIDVPAA
ncbi:MAG: hypothetical protein RL026_762 [Pseudomonadota bacterium]